MKSKFTSFIMIIIIILILGVIGIFGMMIFGEIKSIETDIIPEDFQTVISDIQDTVDKNIETPKVIENPLDSIQDSNISTNVDYSNVTVNKYFYNQNLKQFIHSPQQVRLAL